MSFGNAIPDPHYMNNEPTEDTEVIHFGSWRYVDQSDTRPLWETREPSAGGEVIRPYGEPMEPRPAEQPPYCDSSHGRRKEADRIAEAVRQAVIDGRLSPEDFV